MIIPFAYIPGKSFLHLLDVRLKFFMLCLFSLALVATGFYGCTIYFLTYCFIFYRIKINPVPVLKELKLFFLLLLFVFAARTLSTPGTVISNLMGVTVTRQGASAGALIVYRLFLIMLTGIAFAATTRPSDIKGAVQWFLKPIPFIPEKRLAVMISLAISFMPVILKQAHLISMAQAARCGILEKNPVKRIIRTTVPLMKKIFLSADKLIMAMESRCYTDDRTDPDFTSSGREVLIFLSGVLLSAGLFIL